MAELKTKMTKASVTGFLREISDPKKKKDSLALLKLFEGVTKEKPKMWGTSIIGFGLYHYKSERSSQEGDWFLTGFSPRKQNLTLYLMTLYTEAKDTDQASLLEKLGKFKRGGGCLYINKLEDVDVKVLTQLIKKCFVAMKKKMNVKS